MAGRIEQYKNGESFDITPEGTLRVWRKQGDVSVQMVDPLVALPAGQWFWAAAYQDPGSDEPS